MTPDSDTPATRLMKNDRVPLYACVVERPVCAHSENDSGNTLLDQGPIHGIRSLPASRTNVQTSLYGQLAGGVPVSQSSWTNSVARTTDTGHILRQSTIPAYTQ